MPGLHGRRDEGVLHETHFRFRSRVSVPSVLGIGVFGTRPAGGAETSAADGQSGRFGNGFKEHTRNGTQKASDAAISIDHLHEGREN